VHLISKYSINPVLRKQRPWNLRPISSGHLLCRCQQGQY